MEEFQAQETVSPQQSKWPPLSAAVIEQNTCCSRHMRNEILDQLARYCSCGVRAGGRIKTPRGGEAAHLCQYDGTPVLVPLRCQQSSAVLLHHRHPEGLDLGCGFEIICL